MDLKSRIDKIKPYFISFNVIAEESAAYAIVRFPKGWTIPDKKALKANFKVEIAPTDAGILFATEISNSPECIFDGLDYVIDFNKKVEERKGLLDEKIKELGDLFATETLDRLKTLKFVFEPQKKSSKKTAKKAEPVVVETTIDPVVAPVEAAEEVNINEEVEGTDDNSLLGFAKTIAGE